jgi:hypothetical protein
LHTSNGQGNKILFTICNTPGLITPVFLSKNLGKVDYTMTKMGFYLIFEGQKLWDAE